MKFLVSRRLPALLGAVGLVAGGLLLIAPRLSAQGLAYPWSGYAHDPQHTGISQNAAQPLQAIRWQTPVDDAPPYGGGGELLVHYGSPLITATNTVIIPVRKADNTFRIEARKGSSGALVWQTDSDYILPPFNWIPPFNPVITPRKTLAYPGIGGGIVLRESPDSAVADSETHYFFGDANYTPATKDAYNNAIQICTPLTADRFGNVYFGFNVTQDNPLHIKSGIARISYKGKGTFVTAAAAAGDNNITQPAYNCAPALSRDHGKVYIAVRGGGRGYLLMLNAATLATEGKAQLRDVASPNNWANISNQGTGTPTVGPDGDVYYGVLENPFFSNHLRGWLRHFNSDLTKSETPGAFGWDDTASIVPSPMVAGYKGRSTYLLMVKYNNYAGGGGDGVNRIALLDPNATQIDAITGATVMKEVRTMPGPTPDLEYIGSHPNAVREWCINTAAIDPLTKSIIANCEDGVLYRWDMKTNTLSQRLRLTSGIGEAYTPTVIGVDGTVYAINNATLFAVGYK